MTSLRARVTNLICNNIIKDSTSMEECNGSDRTMEECNGSGSVQWKNAMEVEHNSVGGTERPWTHSDKITRCRISQKSQ